MADQPFLEHRVSITVEAVKAAIDAAGKFNDFGSVLGAQDESMDIYQTLLTDLGRAFTRSQRLTHRIEQWNQGNREAPLL